MGENSEMKKWQSASLIWVRMKSCLRRPHSPSHRGARPPLPSAFLKGGEGVASAKSKKLFWAGRVGSGVKSNAQRVSAPLRSKDQRCSTRAEAVKISTAVAIHLCGLPGKGCRRNSRLCLGGCCHHRQRSDIAV